MVKEYESGIEVQHCQGGKQDDGRSQKTSGPKRAAAAQRTGSAHTAAVCHSASAQRQGGCAQYGKVQTKQPRTIGKMSHAAV